MALLLGLQFCDVFSISNCVVECDSRVLVNLFNGQGNVPWKMNVVFKKLSRYKTLVVKANHCFREGNMVADRLAAVGQEEMRSRLYRTWKQIPKKIRQYIQYDAMRLCNLRIK